MTITYNIEWNDQDFTESYTSQWGALRRILDKKFLEDYSGMYDVPTVVEMVTTSIVVDRETDRIGEKVIDRKVFYTRLIDSLPDDDAFHFHYGKDVTTAEVLQRIAEAEELLEELEEDTY